ncbi:MAG: MFS transporter, partial [Verrucomicrobiae bacterium]|nr:MFS transporter [Verrucomicrobiae bacterium]
MSSPETPRLGRSFLWLNATQFLGALNDNIYRFLLAFCLIDVMGPAHADRVMGVSGAVFMIPFIVLLPLAGVLADRFSKRRIIVITKIAELVIMLLGWWAFGAKAAAPLYVILFLMAAQSAFFGPSKYGIIPELVGRDGLSRANGYIVALTFMATIGGTFLAPTISKMAQGNFAVAGVICVLIAAVGILTSLRIQPTPPAGGNRRASIFFVKDVWRTLRALWPDRYMMLAIFGAGYFFLLGAFFQLNLIPYGMQALGLSKEDSGYLYAIAAIGVGAGGVLAGRISGRHIEFGIVPVGALFMALSSGALGLVPVNVWLSGVWIALLGLGCGMFIVPLEAFIQDRSPDNRRGEILAAVYFVQWTCGLLAAALLLLFSQIFGLSAQQGALVMAVVTLCLTGIAIAVLPDFLARFVGVMLTRFCYRIHPLGEAHIPRTGPALLASNHVSYVDALLIASCLGRRVRFLMVRRIYENRWLNWLFRIMRVIPISMDESPKKILASLREARAALDDGHLVCIFPEGKISTTGLPDDFKSGMEYVLRGGDHPVIPVYLGGVYGSIFSYYKTPPFRRMPQRFPYPVSV